MRLAFFRKSGINPWVSVKSFYDQYVTPEDRIIYLLILLELIAGVSYLLVNALTTHYRGFSYVPSVWLEVSPIIGAVTLLAMYAKDHCPRLAFFMRSFGTFFFIALACAVLVMGVQFTPFPRIDTILLRCDQLVGVSTIGLMRWTTHHTFIHEKLSSAYEFLGAVELLGMPLLLALFGCKKQVNHFFITLLLSFLIGTTIYYFFPTAAPASVLHSQYFLKDQHETYLKFYQIHHHQVVTTDGDGGLIAFPSFHVIWAILLSYVLWDKKWIFIPVALVNFVAILSTVLLGWHYLVDVVGGCLIASVSILMTRALLSKNKYFIPSKRK